MQDQKAYIRALIELHRGIERQGPGDTDYSHRMISKLPELPPHPRMADMGCGAGVGSLMLAERFKSKVRAVDFSRDFLVELEARAKERGLDHLVETIHGDMGQLDWKPGNIDLLWSEGAAYTITFDGALKAWRPLMAPHGVAVISEMNYFNNEVPEAVKKFMQDLYPAIRTEAENAEIVNASGFEYLGIERLPSKAWWDNYYNPLRENIASYKDSTDPVMQSVIEETETEMNYFETYDQYYGYSFYLMKAV